MKLHKNIIKEINLFLEKMNSCTKNNTKISLINECDEKLLNEIHYFILNMARFNQNSKISINFENVPEDTKIEIRKILKILIKHYSKGYFNKTITLIFTMLSPSRIKNEADKISDIINPIFKKYKIAEKYQKEILELNHLEKKNNILKHFCLIAHDHGNTLTKLLLYHGTDGLNHFLKLFPTINKISIFQTASFLTIFSSLDTKEKLKILNILFEFDYGYEKSEFNMKINNKIERLSLLQLAVIAGNPEIIKFLLEKKFDVYRIIPNSPIMTTHCLLASVNHPQQIAIDILNLISTNLDFNKSQFLKMVRIFVENGATDVIFYIFSNKNFYNDELNKIIFYFEISFSNECIPFKKLETNILGELIKSDAINEKYLRTLIPIFKNSASLYTLLFLKKFPNLGLLEGIDPFQSISPNENFNFFDFLNSELNVELDQSLLEMVYKIVLSKLNNYKLNNIEDLIPLLGLGREIQYVRILQSLIFKDDAASLQTPLKLNMYKNLTLIHKFNKQLGKDHLSESRNLFPMNINFTKEMDLISFSICIKRFEIALLLLKYINPNKNTENFHYISLAILYANDQICDALLEGDNIKDYLTIKTPPYDILTLSLYRETLFITKKILNKIDTNKLKLSNVEILWKLLSIHDPELIDLTLRILDIDTLIKEDLKDNRTNCLIADFHLSCTNAKHLKIITDFIIRLQNRSREINQFHEIEHFFNMIIRWSVFAILAKTPIHYYFTQKGQIIIDRFSSETPITDDELAYIKTISVNEESIKILNMFFINLLRSIDEKIVKKFLPPPNVFPASAAPAFCSPYYIHGVYASNNYIDPDIVNYSACLAAYNGIEEYFMLLIHYGCKVFETSSRLEYSPFQFAILNNKINIIKIVIQYIIDQKEGINQYHYQKFAESFKLLFPDQREIREIILSHIPEGYKKKLLNKTSYSIPLNPTAFIKNSDEKKSLIKYNSQKEMIFKFFDENHQECYATIHKKELKNLGETGLKTFEENIKLFGEMPSTYRMKKITKGSKYYKGADYKLRFTDPGNMRALFFKRPPTSENTNFYNVKVIKKAHKK